MVDVDKSKDDTSPLSDAEILQTREKYPDLEYRTENGTGIWSGNLILNHIHDGCTIRDSFKILIDVPKEYPIALPKVKEVGNRTEKIYQKYKDKIAGIIDLHVYPQEKNACVGAINELRDKFPIGSAFYLYVENLVIPYFYGLSYFEKNGFWPWGERSHGYLGLLETYADRRIETSKEDTVLLIKMLRKLPEWKDVAFYLRKVKKSRPCLCPKKGKDFSKCHPLAWEGINKLQKDISTFRINIDQC